jgi:hypothetical protein
MADVSVWMGAGGEQLNDGPGATHLRRDVVK